ncbi:MAG: type IX secretion system membrane protein PorP/SprF [Flavobacteriales bacterium]|nr:type IX secretion system membrane protein PorP/SprF [Flavobacteriales bacterium]
MKKLSLFIFVTAGLMISELSAQQLPQYSQYILNKYVINPASAGTQDHFVGQTNYRSQWEGIRDAPRTYILGVNGPIAKQNMGVGGYIFTDIVGPTRRNGINFSYAYHLKLNNTIKLSFAVNAGILQYSVDGSEITFAEKDDVGSNFIESNVLPDAGFSFYLFHKDFFFGGSAPQLIKNKITFKKSTGDQTGTLASHYFLMGGYQKALNEIFKIEPSFLLKYIDPVPLQYEFTLRGLYKDAAWLGISYRRDDAIGLLLGFILQKNLSLGYSYDIIQSDIKNYSTGSHEIMLSIKFNKQSKDVPK